MSLRFDKTVFISYRRTNAFHALAIYQNLTTHGYDVFFDYKNISAGDFKAAILGNIKARSHFICILTPSALERCSEPNDWLRHEIEYAIETQRNIIPLFFDKFDFSDKKIKEKLTGKLSILPRYNGMSVPVEFFDAAMEKLRSPQFLYQQLRDIQHPKYEPSEIAVKVALEQQEKADAEDPVTEDELTAEEWFESGMLTDRDSEKIIFFTKAIELQPDMVEAYYQRGWVYIREDDLEKALVDFEKSIEIDGKYAEGYYGYGRAYEANEDYDKALNLYTNTLQLDPKFVCAYIHRSNIYQKKDMLEKALTDINEAIRLDPNYYIPYVDRGNIFKELDNFDRALADYDKAIELEPDCGHAYGNRGIVHKVLGDSEKALFDYGKAIELDPNNIHTYANRGNVYCDLNNFTLALADYDKAIELDPDCVRAYASRGTVWDNLNQMQKAFNDYNKAIEIDPNYSPSYIKLYRK